MSVQLKLITVTLMLPVPITLAVSPAAVTRDTLEMESHAWVYAHLNLSNSRCVTVDPKIKETTQTTNQIKCATQCDLTNLHTLKQVAVRY